MEINGAKANPGTALLLAAAPEGKIQLINVGSVFTPLSAVPPTAWTGTAAATVIELDNPVDPQAVLTRIRGAAAADGPLTVVLVGQLQIDRRQRALHVALARTTPLTLRYTALPWAWLVHELQQRRPDTTSLYVDLVASAEAWQQLHEEPLPLSTGTRTYGIIAPPPRRRRPAEPRYTQALAQILRTGHRPSSGQLHEEALRKAGVEDVLILSPNEPTSERVTGTASSLTPPSPVLPAQAQRIVSPVYVPSTAPVPVEEDPHPRIVAASQAGRHQEAAALAAAAERHAVEQFGAGTFAAVHWIEVRAHLASVAQEPGWSCELWLAAAQTRLDALQQAPDTPDVESAVDRAHHQWDRIRDAEHARRLAPHLVALRRRVPGRQRGALDAVQKKVERLNSLPA